MRTTDPCEQGSKQQHRAAQPPDKSTVRNVTANGGRAHAKRCRPDAFDGGAEVQQQLHHDVDVPNPGDVRQHALIRREEARG